MFKKTSSATEQEARLSAEELVADVDVGGRRPSGLAAQVLIFTAFIWSVFQIWYASPLPFMLGFGVINDTEARAIHLAFAVFLAFTAFPTTKRSPKSYIPLQDWMIAGVAAFCAAYLFLFYDDLANRPGIPTTMDVTVGVTGMILLLEATRRALGPPLMIVACIFLLYTFAGPIMPEVIAHRGASLNKGMSHYWLTTEGVFGVALGVSTSMVFLFVLFGALLEQAGAGNYFIRVSFALMGHFRGGPAKAAVVSSAMTGMISGSSIANVVTTGTFTIPLMKKVGFSSEKAGAVEVASSTNGQLTPPIMGAAAFLIVEYTGVPFIEVIKHAFLPAVISYIALVYIVHLEAMKAGLEGLPRKHKMGIKGSLIGALSVFLVLGFLVWILPPTLGWVKVYAGAATGWVVAAALVLAYIALVKYATLFPELDTSHQIDELPPVGSTVKSGLYFLLPVVVLVWCLTVERLSPGLSAFWATLFMMFVVVTQRPLLAFFRQNQDTKEALSQGATDLFNGLVSGARNMIGIGVATAAAGIVVGTVTLTGIGLVMTEFIELISGGSVMLMLIFTAVISLLLGMGLPTTANYIVVSSLMAPVIVELGTTSGLLVPLIAVHLFVFYFGILADDTPPVGLAAFAAAAISQGDPIRTGLQGFMYDIRTAILPFMFIFNTELLMIGITGPLHLIQVIVVAIAAMLVFAAATQGFFLVKNRLWETLALLLIAFTLFRPAFWLDMIIPPLENKPANELIQHVEQIEENGDLTIIVEGISLEGDDVNKAVFLPMGPKASAAERLDNAGISVIKRDGKIWVDAVRFDSAADKLGVASDFTIESIRVKTDRPAKQLFYIPAFVLLAVIYLLQRRRRSSQNLLVQQNKELKHV
ncbi:TRAP transporter permease [Terasakiella sp. A23]|uniref:TRAP transporter permease n=1 Tax=Terasakiella sp. FCG-A23 TaxID=3080561 RepID=UPI0029543D7C|nr:TRAP transporter permease [Terasakiella sp. A23]MDV7341198.1 TRAP transporter permease [Terasakiella sp. A23]